MRFSWTLCDASQHGGQNVSSAVHAYVRRPKNGAVPIRHQKVVAIVKTIRACL
jgi:hypothetical protein